MAKDGRAPYVLGEAPAGPAQHGATPRPLTMDNTKVGTSGGPKPTVEALDAQTEGPRDAEARNK